jgi:arylformamidase
MAVGGLESDEFRRQTRDYVEAWRGRGRACTHIEVPGRNHFDVLHAFKDPQDEFGAAVMRQMNLAAPAAQSLPRTSAKAGAS